MDKVETYSEFKIVEAVISGKNIGLIACEFSAKHNAKTLNKLLDILSNTRVESKDGI